MTEHFDDEKDEIIDGDITEKNDDHEDDSDYEKFCFLCHRPESQAGKMIELPNNIHICNDCMQKSFDTMTQQMNNGLNLNDLLNMPNVSMINLGSLQDAIPRPKKVKKKKENGTKWSEIEDKSQKIYIPLLQAFINEINNANKKDSTMPRKMIEYLIGVEDYYKIVSKDSNRITIVHTFNMHDTLNKPSKNKISAITVPIVKLPTRLVALELKPNSDNTVEMYLDNGWQLSFRIHNASNKVEPSLKFDIQFVSMPVEVLNIECRWSKEIPF